MVQPTRPAPMMPPFPGSSAQYKASYLKYQQIHMAKSEIKTRTLNVIDNIWWKYVPGTTITVRWPVGQVKVGPSHREGWSGVGPYFEYIESADPNDHYRPWLEQTVGKQGWDWNWKIGPPSAVNNDRSTIGTDTLIIKFRKKKAKFATWAALQWS